MLRVITRMTERERNPKSPRITIAGEHSRWGVRTKTLYLWMLTPTQKFRKKGARELIGQIGSCRSLIAMLPLPRTSERNLALALTLAPLLYQIRYGFDYCN